MCPYFHHRKCGHWFETVSLPSSLHLPDSVLPIPPSPSLPPAEGEEGGVRGREGTYSDSSKVDAHRAFPDPVGSMPIGILMAISQSARFMIPLMIYMFNRVV